MTNNEFGITVNHVLGKLLDILEKTVGGMFHTPASKFFVINKGNTFAINYKLYVLGAITYGYLYLAIIYC